MASRSKRPETGKHTVRWRDLRPGEDGRRAQHRRTCPDAATAARLQRDIDAAHALGREYVAPVDTAASIDQIIEAYLDDCERTLKPGTVRQKRNALDLFARWLRIETPRGLLHPDLLSGDRLARWHAWLLKDRDWRGKPVGPLAAGQYVKIVGVAWAWAYESERYGGEVPRPRKIRLVDAWPTLQAVAPTWAQMDQVIEACGDRWWRQLYVVLRFTGLRRSQGMRLLWSDVDLERAELTVRGELGKSKSERKGRIVPISQHLVDELASWGRREGYLVDAPPGRKLMYESARKAWDAVLGLHEDVRRQPCHAFRKGFVSGMKQATVAESTVKALVGHDLGTTGGIYTSVELRFEEMRAAVALIPDLFTMPKTRSLDEVRRRRAQDGDDDHGHSR